MFRSRPALSGLRNAYRRPLLRRNFHPSRSHGAVSPSEVLSSSPEIISFFGSLHAVLDIPYLLVIPLVAASFQLVRLRFDLRSIRDRLQINRAKPLLQAEEVIHTRASAAGLEQRQRYEVQSEFGERYGQSRRSFVNYTMRPANFHPLATASTLVDLRRATGVPQALGNETVGDFFNSITSNHSIQDALLPQLEELALWCGPGPLITYALSFFSLYQAFKLVSTTQFFHGWTAMNHPNIFIHRLFSPGPPRMAPVFQIENGLTTIKPGWVNAINLWNRSDMRERKYMIHNAGFQKMRDIAIGVFITTVAMPVLLNPAQLYFVAASLTFARVRAMVGRLYQKSQEAKWARKSYEPLMPVYRPKSKP